MPTRISFIVALIAIGLFLPADRAKAHFQVLLPATDIVEDPDQRTIDLDLRFTHPMEQGPTMNMARPKQVAALVNGKRIDLSGRLKPRTVDGKSAFACTLRTSGPGDYVVYVEPEPYWEAAEQKMIVHYSKVVIDVLGAEKGWDALVGLPVEIEPLVRPYGLWTGNTFRGIVRHRGKPVPFARVEVEYYNEGRRVKPPRDAFITQVVKADPNGVFSYTMPRAGWWGFAALITGDEKMKNPSGKAVEVELGGLMWVKTVDMPVIGMPLK
jgi:cobalt/nickel transport protein